MIPHGLLPDSIFSTISLEKAGLYGMMRTNSAWISCRADSNLVSAISVPRHSAILVFRDCLDDVDDRIDTLQNPV